MAAGKGARTRKLAADVVKLKLRIAPLVRSRMAELSCNADWFSELCFCILTANYTAEGGLKLQEAALKEHRGFHNIADGELEHFLRRHGHRFPHVRAVFIALAKKHKNKLAETLNKLPSSESKREWLVENVKGLGWKEASHFLRNVGFFDVAIIDRHVLKVLVEYKIISRMPKSLTRKQYLEIEQKLAHVAKLAEMSQGELDFYLWFLKTGKVLK